MTDREEMDRKIAWLKDPAHVRPVGAFAGILDGLWPLLRDEIGGDRLGSDDRWKTLMNAATRIQQSMAEVEVIIADL